MPIYKLLILLLFGCAMPAMAATRIAVLDFELNDITSLPNTPAELQRTASMAPLLIAALNRDPAYAAAAVPAAAQKTANGGFGYLFRFADEAAKLGRAQQADWILVSQHSKPSFLFSYLLADLVEVRTQTVVARYAIELKGSHESVTRHGVAALARQIQAGIGSRPGAGR